MKRRRQPDAREVSIGIVRLGEKSLLRHREEPETRVSSKEVEREGGELLPEKARCGMLLAFPWRHHHVGNLFSKGRVK